MIEMPKSMGGYNIRGMKAFQRNLPNGKTIWMMIWTIAAEFHRELRATMKDHDILLTGVILLSDSHNFAKARDYKWSILSARNGEHPIMLYDNDNGPADDETADLCTNLIRHWAHESAGAGAAPAVH